MDGTLSLLLLAPLFYLIGAFPTGSLLAKARGIDLATQGSGNVGAANVARVLGKRAGVVTLLVDLLKGALATALGYALLSDSLAPWAGTICVAGHCFSIPGRLKGGKGVATALGATLVLCPAAALTGVGIFAAFFALFRIVSVASVSAVLLTPVAAFFFCIGDDTQLAVAAYALLVFARHYRNLERLVRGEEPRFRFEQSY